MIPIAYEKGSRTRQAILDTSRQLFAENGFTQTDIKDIAKSLGITHTAIYYYFKNKNDIASEIYDIETDKIITYIKEIRQENRYSPLFICILQYKLMVENLAFNPATEDFFFNMIDYRMYDRYELSRVREEYYAPLSYLFETKGINKSEDEMTIFILTSDAYAKALLSAIKRGAVDYSISDAFDYFFIHLILPDIDVSFDEYKITKSAVEEFLRLNPYS